MLDATRLRVLVAIARHGSVTAAAQALNYAQPSISHHMARLESETGAKLMERAGRGIRLTEAGQLLAERAEEILGRLDAAEAELAAHVGLRQQKIRLAAFGSALGTLAATAGSALRAERAGADISLAQAEPADALRMLRVGEVDVALVFRYLHGADAHGADAPGADSPGADAHGADAHGADTHRADTHRADSHRTDSHRTDSAVADPVTESPGPQPPAAGTPATEPPTADPPAAGTPVTEPLVPEPPVAGTPVASAFGSDGAASVDDLHYQPLLDEPVYLITRGGPGTPSAPGVRARKDGSPPTAPPGGLADYAGHRWIAGCERCQDVLYRLCRAAGFSPDVAVTTDDYVAAQALVAAGLGIAILPGLALRAVRHPGITATELPGIRRQILAVTYGGPADRPAATATAMLAELAKAADRFRADTAAQAASDRPRVTTR
ncbi:MAG TPA: LysR substrate-binding domain-containing protein [Streptosporangiaceae bacterium]|nr:LysR substrate-binding domain-containing protein [Streptosporangiaceae bacterium]